ncbi:hypothetical protein IEO21_07601 [Rhodonia placenta]|uniref:VHS domain-containing protein n=1 Tax=Rhodonia placenta TaxID=104341 RepID=A0A8H7U073_9APHY|nr:hypothetical protein IEO21_07601 [Postia placenta]
MSAIQLAKQAYTAFNREKPHSSITEWVEILTSPGYADEAYDGIPELVDAISIQATGPAEASRAIRKKLKHGNPHQQYRALVILRALVENGGHNFQTSFADSQLTDAIKMLASDGSTDPKVKKKLVAVLTAWYTQFKDDPSMTLVANLYKSCGLGHTGGHRPTRSSVQYDAEELRRLEEREREKEKEREEREAERRRKEDEKRKAKEEKEKRKREEEGKRKAARSGKVQRKPFDFEQEKPQILTAIANASQASINLVNAITLVNTEQDSLQTNVRVQECLDKAKFARKQIVRYIQLVENEDMIGTLIEVNDRIIAAIETYDTLSRPNITEQDVQHVQEGLAAVKIQDSELSRLQEKQRAAVQRSLGRAGGMSQLAAGKGRDQDGEAGHAYVHPDLQELSFGSLGMEKSRLPPPLRPSSARRTSSDEGAAYRRGSLSDFSDYESSDEGTYNRASTSSRGRAHTGSDEEVGVHHDTHKGLVAEEEDPFADPFTDP